VTRLRSSPLLLVLGAALALAVAVLAFALVRGGEAATGSNPARVTPPTVALFAEVSLKPGGQQGRDVRALLAKVLGGSDVGARVAALVKPVAGGRAGTLDYRAQVEPWLGSRAGVFFRALSGPRSRGTLLLAARDPARARAVLVDGAGAGARRSWHGVTYAVRPAGGAATVVDGFAVLGDEGGVRAAIGAARGYSLAGTDRYTRRIRRIKGERLGLIYFDLLSLGDLLRPPFVSAPLGSQLRHRLSITNPDPVIGIVSANSRALIFDFGPRPGESSDQNAGGGPGDFGTPPGESGASGQSPVTSPNGGTAEPGGAGSSVAPGAPGGGLSPLSTSLLPELPADTWLAFGVPDFGERLGGVLDPNIQQGLPFDALARVARGLIGPGAGPRVITTLGGMAIFVRGSRAGALQAGAVIEVLDPAGTDAAVRRLARGLGAQRGWSATRAPLPGAPGAFRVDLPRQRPPILRSTAREPLYLFARGNRIVAALGRAAASDALDAPRKLGSTAGFRSASAALAPSLRPESYVDLRGALRVLDGTAIARRAGFRGARRLVAPFTYLAYASRNRIRRFALGV
jgi:hypothetical protein